MANDLNAVFAQLAKQSEKMAVDAMRDVAKKMNEMAIKTARKCLNRYYASYTPKRYKRTNQLRKAISFSSNPKVMHRGGEYIISFFIKYDANKLKGLYHSNSWYHQSGDVWKPVMATWAPDHIIKGLPSDIRQDIRNDWGQNNGIPEPEWILNNYLQGIHPWGGTDAESTYTTMTRFFDKDLPSKAGDMIHEEMQDAIIGFLKTYGGGK